MEFHVKTPNGFRFKVVKETDDPMTNRLSIGGSKLEGCYVVFRNDIADCLEVLEEALQALKIAKNKHLTQNN